MSVATLPSRLLRFLQGFVVTTTSAVVLVVFFSRYLNEASKQLTRRKKHFKAVEDVGITVTDGKSVELAGDAMGPEKFNFIVVGGGTAGCALAARLSEDTSVSVLLLEAGPSGKEAMDSRVPLAYVRLFRSKLDYHLHTTEQVHAGKRKLYWPRGKMLGGCSSINAMMFQRGAPSDFDEWAKIAEGMDGASEWAYADFEKYLLKFENFNSNTLYPSVVISARGKDGPVDVGYSSFLSNWCSKWIQACVELGIPHVPDVNSSKGTMGVTKIMTYTTPKGERSSTETAYLTDDVLLRSNLTVVTGAQATKLLFNSTSDATHKLRAVGVEVTRGPGRPRRQIFASNEVILSAGAIHSPHLLLLSGVGPPEELEKANIPIVHALPGVGQHLLDHPRVDGIFELAKGESLMYMVRTRAQDLVHMIPRVLQYLHYRSGVLSSNGVECAAFIRSSDEKLFPKSSYPNEVEDATSGSNAPDLELCSFPFGFFNHDPLHPKLPMLDVGSVIAVLLRPTSTGTLTLNSADPFDQPVLDPNYLATEHDVEVLARGFALALRTARSQALKPLIAATLTPSHDPSLLTVDNDLVLGNDVMRAAVRERTETLYHPTSTCRMAPLNKGGVVDAKLRVHGLKGLRVVDASVFPNIVAGHTAAATIAIAEKAADMIKDELKRKS